MLGRTYDSEVCSAARALELVGERWSLLIVRKALYARATRFSEFQTLGIATNILKRRLDGFVEAGIMDRGNVGHEYVLTEKGRELAYVVIALTEWGDRWAAPAGPPVFYTHASCGGAITLQARCESCGQVHDPAEIGVRPGPGMPAEIAARMG
jgi:DNA-binding HxlR family transcriptional regulator